ncbi:hypothetical protein MA16_Dca028790 [Dendrobium catenatum]|uniref:Uncharacterized protein n=1 Tax=Dendrobium catenatum TaxID=906689 RepID=A0A2I0VAI1_9ASPA|nr:hypothetical protein MA16_Dca028790 [Dendrobium catenatum]
MVDHEGNNMVTSINIVPISDNSDSQLISPSFVEFMDHYVGNGKLNVISGVEEGNHSYHVDATALLLDGLDVSSRFSVINLLISSIFDDAFIKLVGIATNDVPI